MWLVKVLNDSRLILSHLPETATTCLTFFPSQSRNRQELRFERSSEGVGDPEVKRLVGLLLCSLLSGAQLEAQERRFPYEAVVDVDEEFVRSGPGPKYYPTGKLARGDKVTVHRHDLGGWYMIAPPPGSFSWIQAEYVQRIDKQRGRLIANNVIVHVGSSLADERSVYQRTLSKGDSVEILEEVTVTTERGPVAFYKIKPPPREYRWISGKALVPVESFRGTVPQKLRPNVPAAPSLNGPIALDLALEPNEEAFAPSPFRESEAPPATQEATESKSPNLPWTNPELETCRQQLYEIDRKFREMVQQEPITWDLAGIERAYRTLDEQANEAGFHHAVLQRLKTLERYARLQQDYADFHRLTTETRQRDAQLASLQRQLDTQTASTVPGASGPSFSPGGGPAIPGSLDASVPGTVSGQESSPAVTQPPTTLPPRSSGGGIRPDGTRSPFDGAGIIERAAAGPAHAPRFVLMAPDGRLLAYLQPTPGLDLNRYLRQPMGIIGERSYRPELKADLIIVRGLQPVRLRNGP